MLKEPLSALAGTPVPQNRALPLCCSDLEPVLRQKWVSWPKTLSAPPVSHDEHETGSDALFLLGKPGDGLT